MILFRTPFLWLTALACFFACEAFGQTKFITTWPTDNLDTSSSKVITILRASKATDNCTANVTVTNVARLPISAQGTIGIACSITYSHRNARKQTPNKVIEALTAPVPFAVSSNELTDISLQLCPNPSTTGIFQIQSNQATASIQFYDALGRNGPVYFDTITGKIDAIQITAGKYMVRITSDYL